MEQELDYAEMLEIPVNTVNVVKKRSLFSRRQQTGTDRSEDIKERVVESVNERIGAYVYPEDLSDRPAALQDGGTVTYKRDRAGKILLGEAIAAGILAIGIFLTNVFVSNTVINTFISGFYGTEEAAEQTYTEFTLSSVVGDFSDAEVAVTSGGVIYFTAEGCVYPVCSGEIAYVTEDSGLYTLEIAHTSSFTSVVTGLTYVYGSAGDAVEGNIPVGYSDGANEVRVTMYNGSEILSCYTLDNTVPVWNS